MQTGQDVLKLVLEKLCLEEGEGDIPFVALALEALMHERSQKSNPQVVLGHHDLKLFLLEVEM